MARKVENQVIVTTMMSEYCIISLTSGTDNFGNIETWLRSKRFPKKRSAHIMLYSNAHMYISASRYCKFLSSLQMDVEISLVQ